MYLNIVVVRKNAADKRNAKPMMASEIGKSISVTERDPLPSAAVKVKIVPNPEHARFKIKTAA